MEHNTSIIKSVKNEFLNSTIDLTIDYAEIGLDTFLDNNAIREIPFVKTVVGIVKFGLSVKEMFDLKKLLIFLRNLMTILFQKKNLIVLKVNSTLMKNTEIR